MNVESKFATRLYFVPKNKNFPKSFSQRIKLVDLHWDATHVSSYSIKKYGAEEKKRRLQWKLRIHEKVLNEFPQRKYIETRGGSRKRKSECEAEIRKSKMSKLDL